MIDRLARALGIVALCVGCYQLGVGVTTYQWAALHADAMKLIRECDEALQEQARWMQQLALPRPTPTPETRCRDDGTWYDWHDTP